MFVTSYFFWGYKSTKSNTIECNIVLRLVILSSRNRRKGCTYIGLMNNLLFIVKQLDLILTTATLVPKPTNEKLRMETKRSSPLEITSYHIISSEWTEGIHHLKDGWTKWYQMYKPTIYQFGLCSLHADFFFDLNHPSWSSRFGCQDTGMSGHEQCHKAYHAALALAKVRVVVLVVGYERWRVQAISMEKKQWTIYAINAINNRFLKTNSLIRLWPTHHKDLTSRDHRPCRAVARRWNNKRSWLPM